MMNSQIAQIAQNQFENYEYYDRNRLMQLLDSNLLKMSWNEDDLTKHHHYFYKKQFENEKKQIEWILNNLDEDDCLKVKYTRKTNIGRYHVSGKVGLVNLRRVLRNYLCDGIYYDFDMKKANISIMMYLINKYNIEGLNTIKNYYNNYDKLKFGIKNYFQFNDEKMKNMMIEVVFGFDCEYKKGKQLLNKIEKICELNNVGTDNHVIQFLTRFINELKILTIELQKLNIWNIDTSNKKFNQLGSWLSNCIQTVESEIVIGLKYYLINNHQIIFGLKNTNKHIEEHEYDGFKALVENVNKIGLENVKQIICNWLSYNNYNYISFTDKPMTDKLKIEYEIKMSYEESKEQIEEQVEEQFEEQVEEQVKEEIIQIIEQSPITVSNSFSPITIDNSLQEMISKLNEDIETLKNSIETEKQKNEIGSDKKIKEMEKQLKELEKQKNKTEKEFEKKQKEAIKLKEKQEKDMIKLKEKQEKDAIKLQERHQKEQEKENEKQQKEMEKQKLLEIKNEQKKQKQEIFEKELSESRIVQDDNEASILIYEELKDKLKFADDLLYYKTDDNVWINKQSSTTSLVTNYIMSSNIKKMQGDNIVSYAQNFRPASNIAQSVFNKAKENNDNSWYQSIFSSSLGKILFKNGYWDFELCKFVKNKSDDYDNSIIFLEIIDRDYVPLSYVEEIECEKYKKMLFYDSFSKDVGDYYLLQLSRALAGNCMKRALFGIGPGNTGKSFIGSTMKNAFTSYIGNFNAGSIMYNNNSSDDAAKLRWLMLLRSKRIVYSSEMKMGVKIDGNLLKLMSNGGYDIIKGRTHGGEETDFKISLLPIIYANDLEGIEPVDDAVVNRVRAIPYEKVFVDEVTNEFELKKDPSCENLPNDDLFQRCFIEMVFRCYTKYVQENKKEIEPEGIKRANMNIIGYDGGSVINKFLNDYEITNNADDRIPSKEIEDWLKMNSSKVSMTKFGLEMKKYVTINKLNNVANKATKISGKSKVCWFGIKERCEEIVK